jgi:hypothetical protein
MEFMNAIGNIFSGKNEEVEEEKEEMEEETGPTSESSSPPIVEVTPETLNAEAMNQIYKVYLLNPQGQESKLFVFHGNLPQEAISTTIFSDVETELLTKSRIEVVYSNQQIHKDDSIRVIKNKIILEIGKNLISYGEVYLFSRIKSKVHLMRSYLEMTQNETIELTRLMVGQFLFNINAGIDKMQLLQDMDKDVFTYEDLLKLNLHQEEIDLPISLGQQFAKTRDLLFSANPFQIFYDQHHGITDFAYKPMSDNPLSTLDNKLLLNFGELVGRTIYICVLGDVEEFMTLKNIDSEYIFRLYYPHIAKRDIFTAAGVLEKSAEMIEENKKIFRPSTIRYYQTIDLFYDIYHSRTEELPYLERGIQEYEIVLHPEFKTLLPLDAIFKKLHASKNIPFIKYNPGVRRENIYRLHSDKLSRTGKKIPHLSKSQIIGLTKITGKTRQITLVVRHIHKNIPIELLVDFESNGNIIVRSENSGNYTLGSKKIAYLSVSELSELIITIVNPILQQINEFLEQTGYKINYFTRLDDELIEVSKIKYVCSMSLEKRISLNDNIGCLSSIFDVIDNNMNKGAILRFKRVENYTAMDAMAAMITEVYKRTNDERAIINALMINYTLSEEEALLQISKYLNEHTRINGRFVNKAVDIAENPGFPSLFRVMPFENKIVLEVNNIDSISYIEILHVYLDSFLRLTQRLTSIPIETRALCARTQAVVEDVPHIENVVIVAPVASGAAKTIQPIKFGVKPSFFFKPQEEEEEEEEEEEKEEEEGEEEEHLKKPDEEEEEEEGIYFEDESEEEEKEEEEKKESAVSKDNDEEGIFFEEEEEEEEEEEKGEPLTMEELQQPMPEPEAQLETPTESKSSEKSSAESSPEGIFFEEESSPEESSKGGNPNNIYEPGSDEAEELLQSWTKKNAFSKKLQNREPRLFITKKQGKYSGYSRLCPSNVNKQPVILTKEEKDKIDKEHPGSYKHAVQYGTDPENPYWYICPRYWCVLSNTSLTEEEVKNGACGGKIIPKTRENNPPPGHYIYEFTSDKYHKQPDGSYAEHSPGFLPSDSNPEGLCVPCCFKNWDSNQQQKRREECGVGKTGAEEEPSELAKKEPEKRKTNVYIMGVDKFPITQFRWGFLPISIELFLQTNNATAISQFNKSEIQPNIPCLLRYGVEQTPNQSFIGCMADIYAYNKGSVDDIPTISEMRDIIANAMTLDMYLKYHNGSLVSIFQPPKMYLDESIKGKYYDTEFYRSIRHTDEAQSDFFEDTVASFENFLQFLKDDTTNIDHIYLWDIVTSQNPNLFPKGMNLVIMEIADDDVTDNVHLL